MRINQSFCNGFINDCNVKTCENNSYVEVSSGKKYVPGKLINLVERYSGGPLGIALKGDQNSSIISSLCLNLSSYNEKFEGTYYGPFLLQNKDKEKLTLIFNIGYRMYNVEKFKNKKNEIEYKVLKNQKELYIGPDNIIAIQLEYTTSDNVTKKGWLSYVSNVGDNQQLWDGIVSGAKA